MDRFVDASVGTPPPAAASSVLGAECTKGLQSETRSVCVVGNFNTDLLIRGVAALPQWGQEVVGEEQSSFVAGQAGYLALGLAALDVPVSVVGAVGLDQTGQGIVDRLAEAGVGTSGLKQLPGTQTGLTVALVRPDGERAFASTLGASALFRREMLGEQDAVVSAADIIALVGTFMLPAFPLRDAVGFLASCSARGQSTVLDTGWDPQGWADPTIEDLRALLGQVDLFLPNLDEALAMTRADDAGEALQTLTEWCRGDVVIKCGAEGSLRKGETGPIRQAAVLVEPVDAVGAGDAFNAALLAGLASGQSLAGALPRAHAFAAIYVSRRQARYADRDELLAFATAGLKSQQKGAAGAAH